MLPTTDQSEPARLEDLLGVDLIARLNHLDLTSRKIFAGKLKGERRSKQRGDSVEFADHRQYAIGDDLRRIDWNIFGRLDRLFLKLFQQEEDLSVVTLVDNSASMRTGDPSKFRFAQRTAAAVGYIGLANLHRVTLFALGADDSDAENADAPPPAPSPASPQSIPVIRDLRGKRRAHELGRWLCTLPAPTHGDFEQACRRIALSKSGKGVLLLLSDFMFKEGYEAGLRYLIGRGFDVIAIQILSPQEVDPTIAGDLRLVDIEDGDAAEVTISAPLIKRYKANLAAYCEQFRLFCARREIMHLTVQSDMPVDELVLRYLRSRGVTS